MNTTQKPVHPLLALLPVLAPLNNRWGVAPVCSPVPDQSVPRNTAILRLSQRQEWTFQLLGGWGVSYIEKIEREAGFMAGILLLGSKRSPKKIISKIMSQIHAFGFLKSKYVTI